MFMPNFDSILKAVREEQKLDQRGADNPIDRGLNRSTISYSDNTDEKADELKRLLKAETKKNISNSQLFSALVNAAVATAPTKSKPAKPKAKRTTKKKAKNLGADIAKLAG